MEHLIVTRFAPEEIAAVINFISASFAVVLEIKFEIC